MRFSDLGLEEPLGGTEEDSGVESAEGAADLEGDSDGELDEEEENSGGESDEEMEDSGEELEEEETAAGSDEENREGESDQEEDFSDEGEGGVGCVKVVNMGLAKSTSAPRNKLHALVLTPTRELAIQVKNHLVAATKYCNIKVRTPSMCL